MQTAIKNDNGKKRWTLLTPEMFDECFPIYVQRKVDAKGQLYDFAGCLHRLYWRTGEIDLAYAQEVFAFSDILPVLEFGALKYGRNNWILGMKWSRVLDAVLRHIESHINGEFTDSESGLPHLAHAACALMFLDYYMRRGVGVNDFIWGAK